MNRKTAIAVLLAMAAIAISSGAPAAPLSPIPAATGRADVALVMRAHSRNGALIHSTGQLRTFRPFQVTRVRPVFGRTKVRPGRPLAHRKRPHRPRHIHLAGGEAPELPSAIYKDNTQEHFPLSPDFCRYWEDRGVFVGSFEPCW